MKVIYKTKRLNKCKKLLQTVNDFRASLVAQMVKNLPAKGETWVGKIPWSWAWQPTSIFLPGESPWIKEPVGLQSTGSQIVEQD